MRRENLKVIIEKPWFMKMIMYLIVFNSIILGLKSYPSVMESWGFILEFLDDFMISIFVVELIIYLRVYGAKKCFSDSWYVFDFIIISIAVIPSVTYVLSHFFYIKDIPDLSHFSALRAMRVLRILRLISVFPSLRKVIQGLVTAIPGIGSIGTILLISLYVAALMSTNMFGEEFPEWFGSLEASLFTSFQIMTTEGWPDIVRVVMKKQPYAWIFFLTYILAATFVILNLFIAVIVEALQKDESDAEEAIKLRYFEELTQSTALNREHLKTNQVYLKKLDAKLKELNDKLAKL